MSIECTVVSFVPFDVKADKPGLYPPYFEIKASDMKTPELLHVGTAYHFTYLDETRGSLRVANPPDTVARAIVDDYIHSQLTATDEAMPALFWVPEKLNALEVKEKFKLEIIKRLESQKKWFTNVAMLADNDWNQYHKHTVVSNFQRKCAQYIGWSSEQHEWLSPMTTIEGSTCPFCGISVSKGLPVCSNGHIVNPKLHKEIEERLAVAK
jgi:hypothetical protein